MPPSFLHSLFYLALATLSFLAQADTLEHSFAHTFVHDFKKNEDRLATIAHQLTTLPVPYDREPTGTGGYLSQEAKLFSAQDTISIVFTWDQAHRLDAVALFPLRLFTDEIYSDNLYWPGSITIEAKIEGQMQVIVQSQGGHPSVPRSLPELITFAPIQTTTLALRCTDLPQHPQEKWHAAGFAEVCIFSDANNLAPLATCKARSSRQGYHVLAREFLTDGQTPLGLPELSTPSKTHPFIKKTGWRNQAAPRTYTLTYTYPQEVPIDSIRIDPAIQHSYGQSFPVRFTIELLDAQGHVVQSDTTYEKFPLRGPGLNPYYTHFPSANAQSIRFTVLEASRPVPQAAQAVAFSEFTPLHQGKTVIPPASIEEHYQGRVLRINHGDTLDTQAKKELASAHDGFTQAGQILPLRDWIEGLAQRQQILDERKHLQALQKETLEHVSNRIIQGSLALLLIAIGTTTYLITRNRIRTRKEIRTTRAQIASDLHDDVGSNLGTIILHVERLQENSDTPPDEKRLNAIYRLTRESVFGLREVLNTTAPEVGRTQDIVAYMQELPSLILGRTPFTFQHSPAIGDKLADHSLRKGLIPFYKEALYNAKTHSGCTHIEISLQDLDGNIVLQVQDNGQGIDEKTLKKPHTLRTLKQRAHWLHADLKINSTQKNGTHLTLTIPQS